LIGREKPRMLREETIGGELGREGKDKGKEEKGKIFEGWETHQ